MHYLCQMGAAERSTSLEGLGLFLAEHEPCDAGFDVKRPGGSGNRGLFLTCRKCGKSFEYASGTIEIEREIEFSALPAPIPLPLSAPLRKPRSRWRDRIVAATLLLLVLAAFLFALVRINETPSGTASESSPPAQPPTRGSAGLENERLLRLGRFSLAVPAGWTSAAAEGGTIVGPPGVSPATVQVFFEDGATGGLRAMARQSARFARSRVDGRPADAARRTRVEGDPAFQLTVRGPTRTELVLGILAGSTHYLVIGNVDEDAGATQEAAVRRALRTFRPR